MKVNYNVKGKERKQLAQTIGMAIGVEAIYKGVPTCAYEIDYFTVDREGTLIFDDSADSHEVEQVFDAIADAGFEPYVPHEITDSGIAIQMPMMTGVQRHPIPSPKRQRNPLAFVHSDTDQPVSDMLFTAKIRPAFAQFVEGFLNDIIRIGWISEVVQSDGEDIIPVLCI
jgi:hypothetical protein